MNIDNIYNECKAISKTFSTDVVLKSKVGRPEEFILFNPNRTKEEPIPLEFKILKGRSQGFFVNDCIFDINKLDFK